MKTTGQSRREFFATAGEAVSAVALGGGMASLLQGCGGGSPTSASSAPPLPRISVAVANGAIALGIDASSPLSAVGSAALLQSSSGSFLVAHTAQDTFIALTATCTHQACTITGYAGQRYICPCHGSSFDTSGDVLMGPASRSLRQYQATFANNVLTITL